MMNNSSPSFALGQAVCMCAKKREINDKVKKECTVEAIQATASMERPL
jgi:hypothetical protein